MGDINADGISDLVVGAPHAFNEQGASYVIFGDAIANLMINRLTISKSQTEIIGSSNLNATYLKFPARRNRSLVQV